MQKETRRGSATFPARVTTVLKERHQTLLSHIQSLQKAWNEKDLHDVRVSCRRLRSTIRIFLPFLDESPFTKYDAQLKKFMKKFNEIRDLDVQIEQFETLRKPVSQGLTERISTIREHISKRRQVLEKKLLEYIQTPKILESLSLPHAQIREHPEHRTLPTKLLVPDLIEACKRLADISWEKPNNSASLHALRIQLKRLRYGIENLLPWLGKEGTLLIQRLKTLQDLLGWIHDGDVFCGFLQTYFVQDLKIRYRSSKKLFMKEGCPEKLPRFSSPLPVFQKTNLLQTVRFLVRQIVKKRTSYLKLAKNKFEYLERRSWSYSLKEWFETGTCPGAWR
jgi:CHAD domain-containing protein